MRALSAKRYHRAGLVAIAVAAWISMAMSRAEAQTNRLDLRADRIDLYVDDGRPIAKAVELLADKFPYVITYEDPRFAYEGDLKDVTGEIPGIAPGAASRRLVPFGGTMSLSYPVSAEIGEPDSSLAMLRSILDEYEGSASGGRFRVEQTGTVFHIIPSEVRDARGLWAAQASILDAMITIRRQELSGSQMLRVICEAISDATGARIGIGNIPLNATINFRGEIAASNERARDVLLRTLHEIDNRFSWLLLYGPSSNDEMYYLNVHRVVPPAINIRVPAQPPDQGPPPVLRSGARPRSDLPIN